MRPRRRMVKSSGSGHLEVSVESQVRAHRLVRRGAAGRSDDLDSDGIEAIKILAQAPRRDGKSRSPARNPENVDQIIANRRRMYLSEASRDLPVAVSRCPRRPFGKVLPSELRRIAAGLLSPATSKPTLTRARLMTMGIAIHGLALLGSPGGAQADCAAGNGNITTPGACTTPV
jgi:hypothetical protein